MAGTIAAGPLLWARTTHPGDNAPPTKSTARRPVSARTRRGRRDRRARPPGRRPATERAELGRARGPDRLRRPAVHHHPARHRARAPRRQPRLHLPAPGRLPRQDGRRLRPLHGALRRLRRRRGRRPLLRRWASSSRHSSSGGTTRSARCRARGSSRSPAASPTPCFPPASWRGSCSSPGWPSSGSSSSAGRSASPYPTPITGATTCCCSSSPPSCSGPPASARRPGWWPCSASRPTAPPSCSPTGPAAWCRSGWGCGGPASSAPTWP